MAFWALFAVLNATLDYIGSAECLECIDAAVLILYLCWSTVKGCWVCNECLEHSVPVIIHNPICFKFSVFHVACHVLGTWIHSSCNKVFLVNIYPLHHDVSSYPWLLFVCKSFAERLETSRNGYVCGDMGAYHIHSLPHIKITWSTNNHFYKYSGSLFS